MDSREITLTIETTRGAKHQAKRLPDSPGWYVLACTGYAIQLALPTDGDVTCRVCIRKTLQATR